MSESEARLKAERIVYNCMTLSDLESECERRKIKFKSRNMMEKRLIGEYVKEFMKYPN